MEQIIPASIFALQTLIFVVPLIFLTYLFGNILGAVNKQRIVTIVVCAKCPAKCGFKLNFNPKIQLYRCFHCNGCNRGFRFYSNVHVHFQIFFQNLNYTEYFKNSSCEYFSSDHRLFHEIKFKLVISSSYRIFHVYPTLIRHENSYQRGYRTFQRNF